jgi:hypothetical protein
MRKLIGLAARARSGKDTVAKLISEHAEVTCYALADPVKVGCQVLFGLSDSETWDDQIKEDKIPLWEKSPREFFQLTGTEWMRNRDPDHWLLRAERAMDNAYTRSQDDMLPILTDPNAVFKLAAHVFFGLSARQTWDPMQSNEIDPLWKMSPQQMFELIEQLTMLSFPDFSSRRLKRAICLPTREVPTIGANNSVIIKDIRYENEAAFIRKQGGEIWHLLRDNALKVNAHSSELGINIKSGDIVINNNGTLAQLSDIVRTQCSLSF